MFDGHCRTGFGRGIFLVLWLGLTGEGLSLNCRFRRGRKRHGIRQCRRRKNRGCGYSIVGRRRSRSRRLNKRMNRAASKKREYTGAASERCTRRNRHSRRCRRSTSLTNVRIAAAAGAFFRAMTPLDRLNVLSPRFCGRRILAVLGPWQIARSGAPSFGCIFNKVILTTIYLYWYHLIHRLDTGQEASVEGSVILLEEHSNHDLEERNTLK